MATACAPPPIADANDEVQYAAEQGIAEDGALAMWMAGKEEELMETGAEVYAKA